MYNKQHNSKSLYYILLLLILLWIYMKRSLNILNNFALFLRAEFDSSILAFKVAYFDLSKWFMFIYFDILETQIISLEW